MKFHWGKAVCSLLSVRLAAQFLNLEIFRKKFRQLSRSVSVQVLDQTVVVHNPELVLRECDGHKPVVFFLPGMLWIAGPPFRSHSGSCCRTMVSVSNIEGIHS